QGFATIAVGLALGLCAALSLTPALRSLFAGLEPRNEVVVWIATAMVTITAGMACWIPARRVTRIDPMSALRVE
ncbi:MAG TPA: hypothetical protein VKJ01_13965, partial [Candidatus Solibacter sp.]|nr:hypothetical protein [Candidatus Solibacter sp.]